MPDENLEQVKDEIQRGLLFLSTISGTGTVHSALFPILNRLREQYQAGDRVQVDASDTAPAETMSSDIPTTQDYETIIIAIHKAMCEEAFICIHEKPNSVPGFAAAVRELPAHQLPDGWNMDPSSYSLLYKHKAKPGKQFMLTCSVLLLGTVMKVTLTEKNGMSYATDLRVEEFTIPDLTKDQIETALKNEVQVLVRQLIPLPVAPLQSAASSSATSTVQPPRSTQPVTSNDPYYDGRGFIPTPMVPPVGGYTPRFPGVGMGDLHPTFPGAIPQGMPDYGQGSLVGPNHPLFMPNMGGYPSDPRGAPGAGWPAGAPRPRFDSFMPVPGPNGPDFGQQNPPSFGPNGDIRGMRRRVPGEPNPDHLRPPGNNDYI